MILHSLLNISLSWQLYFEYKNMRATFVANKIISFLFLILISRINANQILGGKYVHFWVWSLLFLCWMKKMHSSPIYFMITWKFVRLCDILFMNLKRLQKGKVNIMHLCNWTCINYSTYHEIKKYTILINLIQNWIKSSRFLVWDIYIYIYTYIF